MRLWHRNRQGGRQNLMGVFGRMADDNGAVRLVVVLLKKLQDLQYMWDSFK